MTDEPGLRAALEAIEDIARHRTDDSAWHDVRVIARAAISSSSATETQDGLPDANRVGGYSAYGEPYAEDAYDGATETQDGERPLVGEMLVATRIVTGSGDGIPAGWTWVDTLRPGDRVFRNAATPTPDDRDLDDAVGRLLGVAGTIAQINRDGALDPHHPYIWPDLDAAIQRVNEALAATPAASDGSLDVRRVVQAITNIAVRHGLTKEPPPYPPPLATIYGYSRATPDMDAEIAAEYARLSESASKGKTE